MEKIKIGFIVLLLFCYGCKKHASIEKVKHATVEKINTPHYVIIETNMSECNTLQNNIKNFRPDNIKLPSEEDITGGKPRKPTYWVSTGEGKPARGRIYNSPKDTIGKEIISFVKNEYKLPKSGLDSTINIYGGHYSLLIRQFVNRDEAVLYIQKLTDKAIIDEDDLVFPIPFNQIDSLVQNFVLYSNGLK